MMRLGQYVAFLVIALFFTRPAIATSSGKLDYQPCAPNINLTTDSASVGTTQKPCAQSPAADRAPSSSNIVHASELRAQFSELRLTSEELRSLLINARTRADHQRLAGYYGLRADSDLAEARKHQKIALKYSASPVGSSSKFISGTVDHCVAIVLRLKQHAAKMRKLQQEQEQLAREAGE